VILTTLLTPPVLTFLLNRPQVTKEQIPATEPSPASH
jgi:hypothetical protein